jgi:hypothetical protein
VRPVGILLVSIVRADGTKWGNQKFVKSRTYRPMQQVRHGYVNRNIVPPLDGHTYRNQKAPKGLSKIEHRSFLFPFVRLRSFLLLLLLH